MVEVSTAILKAVMPMLITDYFVEGLSDDKCDHKNAGWY